MPVPYKAKPIKTKRAERTLADKKLPSASQYRLCKLLADATKDTVLVQYGHTASAYVKYPDGRWRQDAAHYLVLRGAVQRGLLDKKLEYPEPNVVWVYTLTEKGLEVAFAPPPRLARYAGHKLRNRQRKPREGDPDEPKNLLHAAYIKSNLTQVEFAQRVLMRNVRTLQRYFDGKTPIPRVIIEKVKRGMIRGHTAMSYPRPDEGVSHNR